MTRYVLALLVLLGCAKRGISDADLKVIEDFRAVEAECLGNFAVLWHEREMRLGIDELDQRIRVQLIDPWRDLAARMRAAAPLADAKLAERLEHYLQVRQSAWLALAASTGVMGDEAHHFTRFRDDNEQADADAKYIADEMEKLGLAPLPARKPASPLPVALTLPPPAPPGPAFFLVGETVVLLDGEGFRVIATEVTSMDVLPDGTMWACGLWRVVHWDGTRTTEMRPKIYNPHCAAGPDGKLWVINEDLEHTGKDQLASFDGKTWKIIKASLSGGSPDQILVDKDGIVYLMTRGNGSFGSGLLAFVNGAWKKLALNEADESPWMEHMFRGHDGHIWVFNQVTRGAKYPLALQRLTAEGLGDPVYIDDFHQVSFLFGTVDAAGVATILDRGRDAVMQPRKRFGLPLPVLGRYNTGRAPGPFDVDAAGRIWVELADGLSVIDRTGKRVVFPLGSLDVLTRPIEQIVVLGAGPALPAPRPARMHSITGALKPPVANVPLVMCGDASGDPPCAPGLPHWDAITDVNGRFSFSNVPRYELGMEAFLGERGAKFWRSARSTCCAQEASEIGDVSIESNVMY